jgi:hypothetical protein
MLRPAAVLALALHLVQGGCASASGDFTLRTSRAPGAGETVAIEIELGIVGPGREIEVASKDGRLLGVISPYGIRAGQSAGTYTVPVPADVLDGNRIDIRLRVTRSSRVAQAPDANEVRSVRAVIVQAPMTEPPRRDGTR